MAKRKSYRGRGQRLGGNKKTGAIQAAFNVGRAAWNNRKRITKAVYNTWKAYSKTKQNRRKQWQMQQPQASGYGQSGHQYTKKLKDRSIKKLYKQMSEPCTIETIDTGAAISSVARQGTRMVGTWFTGSSGIIGGGDSLVSLQTLFNYAQTNAAPAPGYITGQQYIANQSHQSFKLYLQNLSHKLSLTNQSQVDSKLSIYYCFSKISAHDQDNCLQDWTDGLATMQQGTTAVIGLDYPDATPFRSKSFNMRWKVFLKKDLMMPAGYTHEHTESIKIDRLIDMQYANDMTCVRGITMACFIVWQGQPIDDGTETKVSIAPVKMIYTSKWKSTVRFLVHTARQNLQIDNQETGLLKQLFVQSDGEGLGDALLAATVLAAGGT